VDSKRNDLPEDGEALPAILRSLILERDQQRQRANDLQAESLRQRKRAEELYLENLRLQLELHRYKPIAQKAPLAYTHVYATRDGYQGR
jgi:hypothetical protein